jgi:hypothetical protein
VTGLTLRENFLLTDPAVRFIMPDGTLKTAREIVAMPKIPNDFGGSIYAAWEDEDGFVSIGIAQSDGSAESHSEWVNGQLDNPVYKSIDRVDIMGIIIRDIGSN